MSDSINLNEKASNTITETTGLFGKVKGMVKRHKRTIKYSAYIIVAAVVVAGGVILYKKYADGRVAKEFVADVADDVSDATANVVND